jgi:hypothetical protein
MPPPNPHPVPSAAPPVAWPCGAASSAVCRAPGSPPRRAARRTARAGPAIRSAERLLQRRQGQARTGDIGEQATETDRHQQQRLKALVDGEIEQQEADRHHHRLSRLELGQPRGAPRVAPALHQAAPSSSSVSPTRPHLPGRRRPSARRRRAGRALPFPSSWPRASAARHPERTFFPAATSIRTMLPARGAATGCPGRGPAAQDAAGAGVFAAAGAAALMSPPSLTSTT